MELQLTTWERLTLVRIVGSLTGDARLYHKAGKILDVVELTEQEREEIGLRQVGDRFQWKDPARLWELHVNDREAKSVIHLALRNYQAYKVEDRAMINRLWAKCEFDLPEDE